jgi:hypothetical protein
VSVDVLVAIVTKRLNLSASVYAMRQIVSLTVFERRPWHQLLATINAEGGRSPFSVRRIHGPGV